MRTLYVHGERDKSVDYACPSCHRLMQGLECVSCELRIAFTPPPARDGRANSPLNRAQPAGRHGDPPR